MFECLPVRIRSITTGYGVTPLFTHNVVRPVCGDEPFGASPFNVTSCDSAILFSSSPGCEVSVGVSGGIGYVSGVDGVSDGLLDLLPLMFIPVDSSVLGECRVLLSIEAEREATADIAAGEDMVDHLRKSSLRNGLVDGIGTHKENIVDCPDGLQQGRLVY